MEIKINDLSWYERRAKANHRGLVPMRFLEHAMPYRMGDIAGFIPRQAMTMHGAGQAVPYFDDGEEVPADEPTDRGASTTPVRTEDLARRDAIDFSAAIFAEGKLEQIAMAKRVIGVEPSFPMTGDEAATILREELDRRDAQADPEAPAPGVVSSRAGTTGRGRQRQGAGA